MLKMSSRRPQQKKMAIFGRKLVGKEVLKREPIGYERKLFLPKFKNFLAMSWRRLLAAAASTTITY